MYTHITILAIIALQWKLRLCNGAGAGSLAFAESKKLGTSCSSTCQIKRKMRAESQNIPNNIKWYQKQQYDSFEKSNSKIIYSTISNNITLKFIVPFLTWTSICINELKRVGGSIICVSGGENRVRVQCPIQCSARHKNKHRKENHVLSRNVFSQVYTVS